MSRLQGKRSFQSKGYLICLQNRSLELEGLSKNLFKLFPNFTNEEIEA